MITLEQHRVLDSIYIRTNKSQKKFWCTWNYLPSYSNNYKLWTCNICNNEYHATLEMGFYTAADSLSAHGIQHLKDIIY